MRSRFSEFLGASSGQASAGPCDELAEATGVVEWVQTEELVFAEEFKATLGLDVVLFDVPSPAVD